MWPALLPAILVMTESGYDGIVYDEIVYDWEGDV